MILKDKCFNYSFEVSDFVNEHNVMVEQICVMYNCFYLFYWEKEND